MPLYWIYRLVRDLGPGRGFLAAEEELLSAAAEAAALFLLFPNRLIETLYSAFLAFAGA